MQSIEIGLYGAEEFFMEQEQTFIPNVNSLFVFTAQHVFSIALLENQSETKYEK